MQLELPCWQQQLCKSTPPSLGANLTTLSRMSNQNLTNDYVPMGLKMLAAVSRNINSTGHLTQVTDPYSFSVQGDYSPEGQSFVVMAYAAYQDWEAQGSEGANGETLEAGDKENGAGRLALGGLGVVLIAIMGGLAVL